MYTYKTYKENEKKKRKDEKQGESVESLHLQQMTDSQFKDCQVWSEGGGREELSFIFQKNNNTCNCYSCVSFKQ